MNKHRAAIRIEETSGGAGVTGTGRGPRLFMRARHFPHCGKRWIGFCPVLLAFLLTPCFGQEAALKTDASGAAAVTDTGYVAPAFNQRFRYYLQNAYGPMTGARVGFGAAIKQFTDTPPDWGQGMAGFGRRAGSRFGRTVIEETVLFGTNAALGQDTRYFPCQCKGVPRRVAHALLSGYTAKTSSGRTTLAVGRIAGVSAGTAIAVAAWYPDRYSVRGDALRMAGQRVALGGLFNLFLEFWPDVKKRVFGRASPHPNPLR